MNIVANDSGRYRGRFAPSPTGPLHFGSLLAALGSYLEARSRGGEWLVRMEDLDPPRELPGAADDILRTLEQYGFEWDGEVCYQSQRHEAYRAVLADLLKQGLAYRCDCSRREIAARADQLGLPHGVYSGHCRHRRVSPHQQHAVRLLSEHPPIEFIDALQGAQVQDVEREVGDFILLRADGLFAYQLAVVVDDAAQQITHIVRGSDLLDSTPRQILLQKQLNHPQPHYLHLPLARNAQGQKLSKQSFAPAIDIHHAVPTLWQALQLLGQSPPEELSRADLDDLWDWAQRHWQASQIPRKLDPISPI